MKSKQQGEARAAAPCMRALGAAVLCALVLSGLLAPPAVARNHGRYLPESGGPTFEWILLDADTGQVLSEQNADVLTPPASLTKMMTLYLTFEALNQGRLQLNQQLYVSPEAAAKSPSKLGLTPGDSALVRDLILGVVTRSANDAATVLGEALGGSEPGFAQMMTAKARQLGMNHTWYRNASGLPDPEQRTTARDVARLALALYHQFPREYRYFATREFDFRGTLIHSHNHLLDWYPGADGIKTGFVNASGFNLAASAVRDGHRLIGVIMGGHTPRGRDMQMGSLLDQGFAVLAANRGTQPQAAPLVAATAPAQAAPAAQQPVQPAAAAAATAIPATAPAAPPVQTAPATATNTAVAAQRSSFGNVAQTALRHLSLVGKAEAAPVSHEAVATGEDWAIQLGAFRGEAAAEQAARHAAGYAVVRGKPKQILAPARHDQARLYRARLLHFTPKGAQAACTELHKHGIACTIIKPGAVKMASQ